MKVESDDVTYLGTVTFSKLSLTGASTLSNTVTPNVANLSLLIGSSVIVTITNFLGGADTQTIRILGDGTTTITHGTNIFTNTGANKLLAVNKIYTFSYIQSLLKWYENA